MFFPTTLEPIVFRHRMCLAIRELLAGRDFLEIETPKIGPQLPPADPHETEAAADEETAADPVTESEAEIESLRVDHRQALVEIGFDGYGIGGLSVGERREEMIPALARSTMEASTSIS